MMTRYEMQKTIVSELSFEGVALHSGKRVVLKIRPSQPGSGILFRRTDLEGSNPIFADFRSIHSTDLNTTLSNGEAKVSTVEHLLGALVFAQVDNAIIELDGPEVPIMDGSGKPFFDGILRVGVCEQDLPRKYLRLLQTVEFSQADKWIKMVPSSRRFMQTAIEFRTQVIGQQCASLDLASKDMFEVLSSRTFCHVNDVNAMRKAGLALGGSLENAVVVSEEGILNPGGLRHSFEFAKHKLLDLVGDMSLIGFPIIGDVLAYKSGHGLHATFLKMISENLEKHFQVIHLEKTVIPNSMEASSISQMALV